MSKFDHDNLAKGQPLENLVADYFHNRGIPFGFNPYTGTDDPRRADFDLYTGQPEDATLWEAKMDWLSGITGNYFIEGKSLENTKAQKFIIARPWITVFHTDQLRALYNAKNRVRRDDGTFAEQYHYKHVQGGDQASNEGVIVPCKEANQFGKPLWEAVKTLTEQV